MNLHVNLIEDREKRRGGSPHMFFMLRALMAAIPLVFLLVIAHLIVSLRLDRANLARTEQLIDAKKPQLPFSAEVRKQQKTFKDLLAQLDGWKAMRIDWHRQLAGLRLAVPLEVRLSSLALGRRSAYTNSIPEALYVIQAKGKTGGAAPEGNLTRFRQNLLKEPELADLLEDVDVPEGAFVEDTSPDARPMDRLFELNCRYRPRPFK